MIEISDSDSIEPYERRIKKQSINIRFEQKNLKKKLKKITDNRSFKS